MKGWIFNLVVVQCSCRSLWRLIQSNRECWKELREDNPIHFWQQVFDICPIFRCQLLDQAERRSQGEREVGFMELALEAWYGDWCVAVTRRAQRVIDDDQEFQWLRQNSLFPCPLSLVSTLTISSPPLSLLIWLLKKDTSPLPDHLPEAQRSDIPKKKTLGLGSTLAKIPLDQAKILMEEGLGVNVVMEHLTRSGIFALLQSGRFELLDLLPWNNEDPEVGRLLRCALYGKHTISSIRWLWSKFPSSKAFHNPHSSFKQEALRYMGTPQSFQGLLALMEETRVLKPGAQALNDDGCPFFRHSTFKTSMCCRIFTRMLLGAVCLDAEAESELDQLLSDYFDRYLSKVSHLQPSELECPLTLEFQQLIWWIKEFASPSQIQLHLPFPRLVSRLQNVNLRNEISAHSSWRSFDLQLMIRMMFSHRFFHYFDSEVWRDDFHFPLTTLILAILSVLDRISVISLSNCSPLLEAQVLRHWDRVLNHLLDFLTLPSDDLEQRNAVLFLAFSHPLVMRRLLARPRFFRDHHTPFSHDSFILCPFCNRYPNPQLIFLDGATPSFPLLRCLHDNQQQVSMNPHFQNDLMLRRSQSLEMWRVHHHLTTPWVWCALKNEILFASAQMTPHIDQWFLTLAQTMWQYLERHHNHVVPCPFVSTHRDDLIEAISKFSVSGASSKQLIFIIDRIKELLMIQPIHQN